MIVTFVWKKQYVAKYLILKIGNFKNERGEVAFLQKHV